MKCGAMLELDSSLLDTVGKSNLAYTIYSFSMRDVVASSRNMNGPGESL